VRDEGARHPQKGDGVLRDGVGVKHAWVERHKWHWPVSVRWLADLTEAGRMTDSVMGDEKQGQAWVSTEAV